MAYARGVRGSPPTFDDCRKSKTSFFKQSAFFSYGACRNRYHVFLFRPTFLFSLEKLSLGCDATIPEVDFSCVFCLNCIFVINAALKRLISKRVSLNGIYALTIGLAPQQKNLFKNYSKEKTYSTYGIAPKRITSGGAQQDEKKLS